MFPGVPSSCFGYAAPGASRATLHVLVCSTSGPRFPDFQGCVGLADGPVESPGRREGLPQSSDRIFFIYFYLTTYIYCVFDIYSESKVVLLDAADRHSAKHARCRARYIRYCPALSAVLYVCCQYDKRVSNPKDPGPTPSGP